MADVNAIIAQGVRPIKVLNPLDMEAAAAKISSARQEQELNALRMAAYQRGVEEQNALRRSLQESYNPATGEYDLTRARTLGAQYGADPMALQQFASGQETAAVQRENIAAQRSQREQETAARRTRALGLALATAKDDPSDERLNTAFSLLETAGVDTTQLRQQFMAMPVEQRRSVIQNYAAGSEEGRAALAYVAPKPTPQELGNRVDVIDMNPNSPTFSQVLQSLPKGAAPEATPETIRQMQVLGYPITIEGFTAYQSAKGRAAPGTTVTVGSPQQERAFETALGQGQAERILKSEATATEAAKIIDTVNTGRQIMKSGMITGAGAEFFVKLNQALKTAGIDAGYADAAANSQAFAANMANNVGRVIKQFGAGTGLSNEDRQYAEMMAGGKITLDAAAINRILDINEKLARDVIKTHNKNVKGIKTNIPLTVEEPPEIRAGLSAPDKQALDWANANPKDRRAAEIKKRLGM